MPENATIERAREDAREESRSLALVCEAGPSVRFKMNVDGKDLANDLQTPLTQLEAITSSLSSSAAS